MMGESKIIQVAHELFEFFGKGILSLEEVPRLVTAVFIMGAHEARTALFAARLISKTLPKAPVVISGGGDGRGSYFLREAIESICQAQGRAPLAPTDKLCEATLLKRLLVDEGVSDGNILLETKARHSRENWTLSLPIFRDLNLEAGSIIGVVQSPLNRSRALQTGRKVIHKTQFLAYGLNPTQIATIDFPHSDLNQLSERERVIELFRLFGLPPHTQSELKVCEEFCSSVSDAMPVELKLRAQEAEEGFHTLVAEQPEYFDYLRRALSTMAVEVGGVR